MNQDLPARPEPSPEPTTTATTASQGLIPPRPNLGPEPWNPADPGWMAPALLGVGVLGVLGAVIVARRWSAQGEPDPAASLPPRAGGPEVDPWVAASIEARARLVQSLGPAWRSRTTEEIEADPTLQARLGAERLGELAHLFRAADRAKFADPPRLSEATPDAGAADEPPDVAALLQGLNNSEPKQ